MEMDDGGRARRLLGQDVDMEGRGGAYETLGDTAGSGPAPCKC